MPESRPGSLLLALLVSLTWVVHRAEAQVVFEPPVPITSLDPHLLDGGFNPTAATNGAGTWVVAWEGIGDDIAFARSTDGGLTFSAANWLNTDYATDSGTSFGGIQFALEDGFPSVAAHGDRFIAVWRRLSPNADSLAELARSDDAGAHWTAPATITDAGSFPMIASDGSGTWIIAWEHSGSGAPEFDIFFTRSTNDGSTWSPLAALQTNAGTDSRADLRPRLAFAGGVWMAAWVSYPLNSFGNGQVLVARSVNGGATWSPPSVLSPAGDGSEPSIAGDGTGTWVASWVAVTGLTSDVVLARSIDGGLTWSAPTPLISDSLDANGVDVTAGAPGTFVAVSLRSDPSLSTGLNPVVVSASSTDGGSTWSTPVPLNPADADAAYGGELDVRVTYDPATGRYFALWRSNDPKLANATLGNKANIVMALAGHPCGNGVVDAGEACDDGDRGSLDCCGRACQFEPADTVCAADADLCTLERCDGGGTCGHTVAPAGTRCDADADLCTFDRCNASAVCEHVFEPPPGCVAAVKPRHSTVRVTDAPNPAKRKVSWTWKFGAESGYTLFVTGANSALCLYDGTGLVDRLEIPAGGVCRPQGRDCWFDKKGDPAYADPDGTPDGVTKITFKQGPPGKNSIKLVGRGANLPAPTLPVANPPLRAVFMNDLGRCFDATYSSGFKNSSQTFSGKSD